MPCNEVVAEHGNRAASESRQRIDLELDVQPGHRRESIPERGQGSAIGPLIQESIPACENIEFKVIVRLVTGGSFQDSPFPAPIATAKNDGPQATARNNAANSVQDQLRNALKV